MEGTFFKELKRSLMSLGEQLYMYIYVGQNYKAELVLFYTRLKVRRDFKTSVYKSWQKLAVVRNRWPRVVLFANFFAIYRKVSQVL